MTQWCRERAVRQWLLLAVLGSASVSAAPDHFWLGDGHSGPLTVPAGQRRVINPAVVLASAAPRGASTLIVDAAPVVSAGDLVMVLVSKGLVGAVVGSDAGIDLTAQALGRFELARVASVAGLTVTLTEPLEGDYPSSLTQVLLVPEYTSVSVAATGAVVAAPWDGRVGGVVAMLVQTTVSLDGAVSASGAGYRAGPSYWGLSSYSGCVTLEELEPDDGGLVAEAPRGEGAAVDAFPKLHGYGNHANAGGGGVCHESGGGGGAHRSPGGQGGLDQNMGNLGGFGGAPVVYAAGTRLIFGGGGGAGEQHHTPEEIPGGAGGGVVFIRANQLTGAGTLDATGASAPTAIGDNGAGGGGAGGTIVLRLVLPSTATGVYATGGDGGSTRSDSSGNGNGGGGSGGVVWVVAPLTARLDVQAGLAGLSDLITSTTYRSAGPDPATRDQFAGNTVFDAQAARPVSVPIFATPSEGSFTPTNVVLTGRCDPNATLALRFDGVDLAAIADPSGQFAVPANGLALGIHTAKVRAFTGGLASDWSPVLTFTVGTAPDAGFDGGPSDAGPSDSGPDAATPDAGSSDGGFGFDAGSDGGSFADAGFAADAGSSSTRLQVGCGCDSGLAPLALAALFFLRRSGRTSVHTRAYRCPHRLSDRTAKCAQPR